MAPILITGGTGLLGRAVVHAAGERARVLSRRPGPTHFVGDLSSGAGLDAALDGVDTVIHCATTMRGPRDVVITERLVAAATDLRHLVFVSVVGVDRIPLPYYRGKLAAERVVERVPHTILRATQFHDLIRTFLAGAAKLPVMPVPNLRVQPVDVRDVAARLVELAAGEPRGRAPDFGGPEPRRLPDLAVEYLHTVHKRRLRLPFPVPGKALRAGANLASGGTITFGRYLAEHPAPSTVAYRGKP